MGGALLHEACITSTLLTRQLMVAESSANDSMIAMLLRYILEKAGFPTFLASTKYACSTYRLFFSI